MSNAMAEAAEASNLANILVKRECDRASGKGRSRVKARKRDADLARERVARALGTSPGTIENLQRGRLKRIAGWLRDALRQRVIRELEAELVRLHHELAILKQKGGDPRSDEAAAVRADMSAILAALGRDR